MAYTDKSELFILVFTKSNSVVFIKILNRNLAMTKFSY